MRRLGTIGFVLLCVPLALGASARAQEREPFDPDGPSQRPFVEIVAPDEPVPRNGSFLFWASNDGEIPDDFVPEPVVQIAQTAAGSTRTFGGSLRNVVGSYWAWQPTEPLEPGEYDVSLAHSVFGMASARMTVVGDAVLEPPALSGEPIAKTATQPSREVYCQAEEPEQPFDTPLFATHERRSVFVDLRASFGGEPGVAQQFLYRLFTNDFDFSPFHSLDALRPAGPFARRADEYCFHVEAMAIATGAIHSFPGFTLCAPDSAALGEIGERALPVTDEQLSRYACSLPPEGFEERWCEVNDQCIEIWEIEGIIDVNGCREYFDACPDAQRPDGGTGGNGGAGGRIDFEPTDAGGPDDREPRSDAGDDAPASDGDGCGCSTIRASEPAQRAPLAWAALALLAFVRIISSRRAP